MQDKKAESIKEFDLTDLKMPIIVIYRHPEDYPDKYVARIFDITQPTDAVVLKDSLQELQSDITRNMSMTFLARDEKDDPHFVGSWI